jgi:anaerobic magnesium-protoporphyrin IX monomethyl ester cyclase
MKVSLLYPSWTREYDKISHFAKKAGRFPPLNLAYLGAIAEEAGHEVRITDGESEELPLERIVDGTLDFQPDVIGITATTPFYHLAVELATALKKRSDAPIAIGGPHITVLREKVFDDCFDFGFVREAETSWANFLERWDSDCDVKDVKGILYREGGEVKYSGDIDPVKSLDSLPIPARHLLKNEMYRLGTMEGTKQFTSIITVRGCPFKCIFCSTEVFGNNTSRRSPEKVVEEMAEVVERYGTNHFMILDDTLTLYRPHIEEICDRIISSGLDITFEGSTRANLIDEDLVKKMKTAGLTRLSFGLETVDEGMRKRMRKNVPLGSYKAANFLTNKYGIETLNSCMIGLPGETEETIRKTLRFLRESKEIKQANISIAVPYPGTELYALAEEGKDGLSWADKDFSQFRRYNSAVMQVGNLSPEDLVDLQNEAFASIYLAPWRWMPMIKKSGLKGAWLTGKRLWNCLKKGNTRFLTNKQLGIK